MKVLDQFERLLLNKPKVKSVDKNLQYVKEAKRKLKAIQEEQRNG